MWRRAGKDVVCDGGDREAKRFMRSCAEGRDAARFDRDEELADGGDSSTTRDRGDVQPRLL